MENIVVGIPYTSHESNGSVLDVDNQTATVNKVQVQNQSNGLAVLSESQTDTKVNSTPGLPSLEAMMAETVTDTFDDKKGMVQALYLQLEVCLLDYTINHIWSVLKICFERLQLLLLSTHIKICFSKKCTPKYF